jgi:hypothetical protein
VRSEYFFLGCKVFSRLAGYFWEEKVYAVKLRQPVWMKGNSMRYRAYPLMVVVAWTLMHSFAHAQQADQPLTLEGTKQYLKEKIPLAGTTLYQGNGSLSFRYESVSFEGDTLKLRVKIQSDMPGFIVINRVRYQTNTKQIEIYDVSFSLNDFTPENVEVKRSKGKTFSVMIKSNKGKKKIYSQVSITTQWQTFPNNPQQQFPLLQKNVEATESWDRLEIVFSDEDCADRLAKAISHAIGLSKDKPDPFQFSQVKNKKAKI